MNHIPFSISHFTNTITQYPILYYLLIKIYLEDDEPIISLAKINLIIYQHYHLYFENETDFDEYHLYYIVSQWIESIINNYKIDLSPLIDYQFHYLKYYLFDNHPYSLTILYFVFLLHQYNISYHVKALQPFLDKTSLIQLTPEEIEIFRQIFPNHTSFYGRLSISLYLHMLDIEKETKIDFEDMSLLSRWIMDTENIDDLVKKLQHPIIQMFLLFYYLEEM